MFKMKIHHSKMDCTKCFEKYNPKAFKLKKCILKPLLLKNNLKLQLQNFMTYLKVKGIVHPKNFGKKSFILHVIPNLHEFFGTLHFIVNLPLHDSSEMNQWCLHAQFPNFQ